MNDKEKRSRKSERNRLGMKGLSVEVLSAQHQFLSEQAARRGWSKSLYVRTLIENDMEQVNGGQNV